MGKYLILVFTIGILLTNIATAITIGQTNSNNDAVVIDTTRKIAPTNVSAYTVNSSFYWQGYDPNTYLTWISPNFASFTWNKTYADTLYYSISNPQGYLNSSINSTYLMCYNNASYLSTFNVTYNNKADYNFNNHNFNGSGNVSAGNFIGDGSKLKSVNYTEVDPIFSPFLPAFNSWDGTYMFVNGIWIHPDGLFIGYDNNFVGKDWGSDAAAIYIEGGGDTYTAFQVLPNSSNYPPGSFGGTKVMIGFNNPKGGQFDLDKFVSVGQDGTGNLIYTSEGSTGFVSRFILTPGVGTNAIAYFNKTNVYMNNELTIKGNISVKRPFISAYCNYSQPLNNVSEVQIINISNNVISSYGIHVLNNQNITFDRSGVYRITISPEFFEPIGQSGIITFWFRQNGTDAPWSNSRYTLSSNIYLAPEITFEATIHNPSSENIQVMWWSDNANTQLYASGVLTSPTRPSIPSVILTVDKMSEVNT